MDVDQPLVEGGVVLFVDFNLVKLQIVTIKVDAFPRAQGRDLLHAAVVAEKANDRDQHADMGDKAAEIGQIAAKEQAQVPAQVFDPSE